MTEDEELDRRIDDYLAWLETPQAAYDFTKAKRFRNGFKVRDLPRKITAAQFVVKAAQGQPTRFKTWSSAAYRAKVDADCEGLLKIIWKRSDGTRRMQMVDYCGTPVRMMKPKSNSSGRLMF